MDALAPRIRLGQLPDDVGAVRLAANLSDSKRPIGTHEHKIDDEQRARRRAKAIRTASHGGQATHKPSAAYHGKVN